MKRIIINHEETDYSIDKEGKIFSNKTNKFLLGSVYNTGYRMVRLTIGKNKKSCGGSGLISKPNVLYY